MNLSKKSWHARLYQWMEWKLPDDLCTYFWMYVFMVVGCTILLWLGIGGIFAGVSILYVLGCGSYSHPLIASSVALGLALLVLIIRCRILWAWLKAKKEGLCPLIDWQDDA